jgi:hypothetical protein
MAHARENASLGELFSDLTQETSTLVRQEVQLAKAELRQSAEQVGRSVASMLVGGAVAYAGFLALLAAVILGLGEAGVPWWLSALIVGIVVAAIGMVMVMRARSGLRPENLAPKETIESLKEDREWVKEQIR